MTTPPDAPVEEVDEPTLRRLFNDARIDERAARGEFTTRVRPGSEHAASSTANEPPGTLSHILQYLDSDGGLVAQAHEYRRRDGTIGATGRRDPKWLYLDGVIYKQRRGVRKSSRL